MKYLIYSLFAVSLFFWGCETETDKTQEPEEIAMLKAKIERFAPTELKYDSSILDERQKMVVENLYQASKVMDDIFLTHWPKRKNVMNSAPSIGGEDQWPFLFTPLLY